MENRYYTPELEEFHIGFEYELIPPIGYTIIDFEKPNEEIETIWSKEYVKGVFLINDVDPFGGSLPAIANGIKNGKCRVRHLNSQDIQELGFEEIIDKNKWNFLYGTYRKDFSDDKSLTLRLEKDICTLAITDHYDYEGHNELSFKIKNKSELKKLLEKLNYDN